MKFKVNNTVFLSACVLVLVVLCCLSVGSPVRFQRQREEREAVVRQRLVKIRTAEAQYLARHGTYAGSFALLVRSGLLADSLSYIPFAGGVRFSLKTAMVDGIGGRQIPVMECGALYSQYLQGLDDASVASLTEEAGAAARFPGLKIGDLEVPNNNAGNWE